MRHRIKNSRPFGIRNIFRKKRTKRTGRRLLLESLEDRRLLAVTQLTPEADALVYQYSAATNYGNFGTLYATGGGIESYLRFNLAGIGGDVTNATLVLQPYYNYAGSGLLYAADDNWDEMTITWNNQPDHGSQALASFTSTPNVPLQIDVTSAVQAETSDGLVSFYIRGAGAGDYSIFYSDENGVEQYRPQLVVETGGGSTNQPPVAVNDFRSVNEDTDLTISVLANDSDPDGDALSLLSFT
ncbi:MAG TPA: DNRLRE domain-containing protein, partial [Pirellulaceae bacterium]|nr:DNRLRE domain-containing protein [Pirellulaceae bacterium]